MLEMSLQDKMLAFMGQQTSQVKHVQAISTRAAHGRLAEIYQQIEHGFAVMPPFSLHSPAPDVLAGLWVFLAETLTASGQVPRRYKESVATAVSQINQCPYCVDAHAMMLHGVADRTTAEALRSGNTAAIQDERVRSLVNWALATRTPDSPLLASPPFAPSEAPEIIGTAVGFHYINRMANIFLDTSPMPLPTPLRKLVSSEGLLRMGGAMVGQGVMRKSTTPGGSLHLLPEATLPGDCAWAMARPTIAAAIARFCAVLEGAVQDVLPQHVRDLVLDHLQQWNGQDMGISRRWAEDAVAELNEDAEQSLARLLLLTALASYQVDADVIAAFRKQRPGDDQLIAATAWASLHAARRIATWLPVGNG
jgi:AhpD family alkylhydroperoxidase